MKQLFSHSPECVPQPPTDHGGSMPDKRLQQALQLMQARLAYAWQIEELAAAVALCPRQLERIFKTQLRLSPMQYLQTIRLFRAAELLATTFTPIKQIAAEVGYVDERAFRHAFKQSSNRSPLEFRQQSTEKDDACRLQPANVVFNPQMSEITPLSDVIEGVP